MNTKRTRKSRTNTPRERGVYKSYSLRILKRDLDRLQRVAWKQKISFNTWAMNALLAAEPVKATPAPIVDPELLVVEVPSGDALQV